MPVSVPIAAFGVDFNVSGKFHSVYSDYTSNEIGSGIGVVHSRSYYFEGNAVCGFMRTGGK